MDKFGGFFYFFDLKKLRWFVLGVVGRNNLSLISNIFISCAIKKYFKAERVTHAQCLLLTKSHVFFLSRHDVNLITLQPQNRSTLRDLVEEVPYSPAKGTKGLGWKVTR